MSRHSAPAPPPACGRRHLPVAGRKSNIAGRAKASGASTPEASREDLRGRRGVRDTTRAGAGGGSRPSRTWRGRLRPAGAPIRGAPARPSYRRPAEPAGKARESPPARAADRCRATGGPVFPSRKCLGHFLPWREGRAEAASSGLPRLALDRRCLGLSAPAIARVSRRPRCPRRGKEGKACAPAPSGPAGAPQVAGRALT